MRFGQYRQENQGKLIKEMEMLGASALGTAAVSFIIVFALF